MLLQVIKYPIGFPAAADVMTNNGVEHSRSIGSCRRSFPHDLLNLVDTVFAATAIEVVAVDRRAAVALRRSPQTKPQSSTLLISPSSRIAGSSVAPVMVSALLVRRNSSAAICLPSTSNVNLRLSGSPSAMPQIRTPSPDGVTS